MKEERKTTKPTDKKVSKVRVISGDKDEGYKIVLTPSTEFTETDRDVMYQNCHENKNLLLCGYPHGHETRRELAKQGTLFDKIDSPEICLAYFIKDRDKNIEISIIVSDEKEVLTRLTKNELSLFLQIWQQSVVEGILKTLNGDECIPRNTTYSLF